MLTNLDASYFLHPQSCEKRWLQFVQTPSNDVVEYSEEIMTFLKNMMFSFTEDTLTVAASVLESSTVWQNSLNLRDWFQSSWLLNAKVNALLQNRGNLCYTKIGGT